MAGKYQPYSLQLPTDPYDIGYLAALVDGEGCIQRYGKDRRYWRVVVTGTSTELKVFLGPIGGMFYRKIRYSDRHAEAYNWTIERQANVLALLDLIVPHLRIKQHTAIEAIDELTRQHELIQKSERKVARVA